MKQLFTLFFSSTFAVSAFSQTTVFSEDFESGIPATWTIHIQDANTVDSTVIDFAPGWIGLEDPFDSTNHVAGATSYFDPVGRADRWLVTPPVTLGAFGNVFSWSGRSHDPSFQDAYMVVISTTNTDIESFTDTLMIPALENEEWTRRELNLSDSGYNSQTVYLAFVLRTYDGFKLYIDSVGMRIDDPVGIAENKLIDMDIFPNPASDFISVSAEQLQSASVISMQGILVLEEQMQSGEKLNVSSLSPGTYILSATTANGVVRKRFVKR